MTNPAVGRQIVFKEGHPQAGKRGQVIGYREVMLWPELGPMPVVQTEDGVVCMITDLLKDWRYVLRIA